MIVCEDMRQFSTAFCNILEGYCFSVVFFLFLHHFGHEKHFWTLSLLVTCLFGNHSNHLITIRLRKVSPSVTI